ncbi:hypothetical protein LPA44_04115 [Halobacterium sp. KA-4]|uniref:hypothetical protein n=1 Tax=Halobacterium sp. KA-4 TaxID=2896367 RepID=UPI001E421E0C|nr:hypothetical protein [Halobacterium sp. KA-4]MCD2199084.1 hypothetical protein [Halobacterium sp. KA-4]
MSDYSPSLEAIREQVGNRESVTAVEVVPSDGTATALPSHDVPEGVSVLVMALDSNDASSRVYVGDGSAQPAPLKPEASLTFTVTNTDAISIRAPTAGDGVAVLFESDT